MPDRRDPVPAADRTVDPDAPIARESLRREWDIMAAIAIGGVLGAEARYGIDQLLPAAHGTFPWATFVINVLGCLAMGALMVVLTEMATPHRLARPFLGVGLLGGFTTFSSFAVDAERLIDAHRPGLALVYVAATLVVAALALWLATIATRAVGRRVRAAHAEQS